MTSEIYVPPKPTLDALLWLYSNNTVPLQILRQVKYFVWYIVVQFSKFSTILSACQPAARPGSTNVLWLQFFHTQK